MKPADKVVTVLLVDDHAPVRQGLRTLLGKDVLIRIVGEARDGREAVQLARKLRPRVILMDISMPVMNGLDATSAVMADNPAARVIILSAQDDPGYVSRARTVGAVGYVAKQRAAEILPRAIHEAAQGIILFSASKTPFPSRRETLENPLKAFERPGGDALSAEDSELLKLVAQGVPKRQIALRLRARISTIDRRIQALMAKLGMTTVLKLAEYGIASGCTDNDVEVVIV